jgi:hypothetical protein
MKASYTQIVVDPGANTDDFAIVTVDSNRKIIRLDRNLKPISVKQAKVMLINEGDRQGILKKLKRDV